MVDWSLARHAARRATPLRPPIVAAVAAVAAFLVLGSVDATGPQYPSAVVVFGVTLLIAGITVLDELRRNTGRQR
jgi:uncharacterized membrane protein YjjP (DUF1212 family)